VVRFCSRKNCVGGGNPQYWKPENKQYSDEEWSNLSYGQRQAVIHFRRGIKQSADNANNHGNERHINQMTHDQDQQSLPSQVQFSNDNSGSQANRNNTGTSVTGSRGSAGSAFNGNRGN
jgi:hypothetical protein